MNYEKEYIRLWNAAKQVLENIDFETKTVGSWASIVVLENAVDWGRDKTLCPPDKSLFERYPLPNPQPQDSAEACECTHMEDGADGCPYYIAWGKCAKKHRLT